MPARCQKVLKVPTVACCEKGQCSGLVYADEHPGKCGWSTSPCAVALFGHIGVRLPFSGIVLFDHLRFTCINTNPPSPASRESKGLLYSPRGPIRNMLLKEAV